MTDGADPVIINGQQVTTQAQALQYVAPGDGFDSIVPEGADLAQATSAVKKYYENVWQCGGLITNNNTFVVTQDGIDKALQYCAQGVDHTSSVTTVAERTKSAVSGMFGSCAEAAALQQQFQSWLDTLHTKATKYQAVLNGVSDGTKEIQTQATRTDASWARGFHRTMASAPATPASVPATPTPPTSTGGAA